MIGSKLPKYGGTIPLQLRESTDPLNFSTLEYRQNGKNAPPEPTLEMRPDKPP